MNEEKLKKLGLNKNEAKVYDCLIVHKNLTAGEIIKETKIHRNLVYQSLEKLIDLGLVSFIIENKRKVFSLQNLEGLTEFLDSLEKELEEKKKIAKELKDLLEKESKTTKNIQQATIFRGIKGVQTAMNIILKKGKDYFVLGAPKESTELMPPAYWIRYNKILKENKIEVKMLFNEDLEEWTKENLKHLNIKIKFLPKRFDSIAQTNICFDSIFIYVWSKTPIVVYVQDNELAKTYKKYFEELWKMAKP